VNEHASDVLAAAIGKNMAVGGGTSALVFGGLAISDWAAIGGVLIAVIGLGIQLYYKRRSDKREAQLLAAQLEDYRRHV
jgi:hypothetical protein